MRLLPSVDCSFAELISARPDLLLSAQSNAVRLRFRRERPQFPRPEVGDSTLYLIQSRLQRLKILKRQMIGHPGFQARRGVLGLELVASRNPQRLLQI